MTLAWQTPLPHADKIVLLALSDNANDEGFCYPSIATLSRKCGLEERSIHRVIVRLEDAGHVTRRERPGRSTVYTVHPLATPDRPSYRPKVTLTEGRPVAASGASDTQSGPPLTEGHTTPDRGSPITVMESSVESPPNRQVRKTAQRLPEGFGLTEDRRAVAVAEKVDAQREFGRFRDHWLAASGANARKHNWDAAWRNWCRKAADMKPTITRGPGGPVVSAAQLEADGLRKLMDRRQAIGIPNFRDPTSGETSAQYGQAQNAECNRLMVEKERRRAVNSIADLAAAKRISP